MKPLIPVLIVGVAITIAIANGIASAHGLFKRCAWLAPVLYGTAATLLITAIATAEDWRWLNPRFYVPVAVALLATLLWTVAIVKKTPKSLAVTEPIHSGTTNNYPRIEFKQSEEYIFRAVAFAIAVTIASFRNDAIAGRKLQFSAQVIYKSAEREIANLARATWFPVNSHHPTTTTFDTGTTRSLGVFFFKEGKLYKPLVDWAFEGFAGYQTPFPRIRYEEFTEKVTSLEIRFLSGDEKPKIFHFDVGAYGTGRFPILVERKPKRRWFSFLRRN
jgi:hypothetical protein